SSQTDVTHHVAETQTRTLCRSSQQPEPESTHNQRHPPTQQTAKTIRKPASIGPIKLSPSPPDKQRTQPPEPTSCEVIFSVSPSRRLR
ncbi:hypothetical protein, partial [Corynebacterium pseudodiphtheriticum]|uniref:hypothetical protein n=1 Tax=Corynebacterium pseudodiphtheriticum TaxID=37637 RepID=UPI001EE91168